MDFVIKFSARTATLFQTFARMPILFIFCKFYKVPSTKAANLVASSFFQPQAPRFCEGPAFFRHRRQIFCLLLLPVEAPLLRRPAFSPQAASLLPPRFFQPNPSLLRSSRLYEVLAFIQKLTFEKEPKRLSVGQARNRMETNGGDPGKFSQAAFLGSQPRNLRRPQTARLTAKKIAAACLPVVEYWYMFPSDEAYIPLSPPFTAKEKKSWTFKSKRCESAIFPKQSNCHHRDAL